MPVEIMLLPRWFPFHSTKISYWARTVLVPLLVLAGSQTTGPQSAGRATSTSSSSRRPRTVRDWPTGAHQTWASINVLRRGRKASQVDRALFSESRAPPRDRRPRSPSSPSGSTAIDGLGAIYPAMANAVLMFDALGYPPDHPHLVTARRSIERLLVLKPDEAYCQPCVSPVWDTALAAHALLEAGDVKSVDGARAGLAWLGPLQVLDVKGDWAVQRPDVQPGGWAFQYANAALPRPRRHRRGRNGDGQGGTLGLARSRRRGHYPCARMGKGLAKP